MRILAVAFLMMMWASTASAENPTLASLQNDVAALSAQITSLANRVTQLEQQGSGATPVTRSFNACGGATTEFGIAAGQSFRITDVLATGSGGAVGTSTTSAGSVFSLGAATFSHAFTSPLTITGPVTAIVSGSGGVSGFGCLLISGFFTP